MCDLSDAIETKQTVIESNLVMFIDAMDNFVGDDSADNLEMWAAMFDLVRATKGPSDGRVSEAAYALAEVAQRATEKWAEWVVTNQ